MPRAPGGSVWFFWDTRQADHVRAGVLAPDANCVRTYRARASRSLPTLARLIDRLPTRLRGICVVAGPGSFSAIRTGVLQANLLARLIQVPLVGVRAEDAVDLDALGERLRGGSFRPVSYVAPVYDREPNITVSVC